MDIKPQLAQIIFMLQNEMTKNQPDDITLRFQGEYLIKLSEQIKNKE